MRDSARRRPRVALVAVAMWAALAIVVSGCGKDGAVSSTTATSAPASNSSGSSPGTGDTGAAKKVFKEDDTDIKVLSGEKFAIRLPENSSIGDRWVVISQPDPSFVKDDGDSFKPDSATPMPGSGGQHEFKYKARSPGTTTITFYNCYRCTAGATESTAGADLARRVTFTVTVS